MNFLAHLVLAPQTPEGLVGSIAPDMIRGPLPADLPLAIMAAAKEHQRIDQLTDAHAAFARTRDRLRAVVDPRLAGILADMLYDHVLARDWARWRQDDFEAFVTRAESDLLATLEPVPVRMQVIVRKMVEEHWLLSYASAAGIHARLKTMSRRLAQRLGRPMSLLISEDQITEQYAMLAEDFAELWPHLLAQVDRIRQERGERLAG